MPKKERVSARKIKDKWKAKSWYSIHAPEMFNRTLLGETPSEDPSKLMGRVTEVTVQDITGDFSKMHIKLQFKAHEVKGSNVETRFIGHDMTSDYIRRLTRRKRSRIDGVYDIKTKDGALIRVKSMAIADRRIQSSKQNAIRKIMGNVAQRAAKKASTADFIKSLISGEMAKDMALACKPVQPIFRVEIRKSELLRMPGAELPPLETLKETEKEVPKQMPEAEIPSPEEPEQPEEETEEIKGEASINPAAEK